MAAQIFIFGVLALVVVGTALAMLLSRNPVYSALFLVVNFTAVAVLYFILGAPFIALAQITVYAGAIMVLFLFVIMLMGAEKMPGGEPLRIQRPLAIVLAVVILAQAGVLLAGQFGAFPRLPAPDTSFGDPKAIGALLFTRYALPLMVLSVVLLIATVGAVVLTRTESARAKIKKGDQKHG